MLVVPGLHQSLNQRESAGYGAPFDAWGEAGGKESEGCDMILKRTGIFTRIDAAKSGSEGDFVEHRKPGGGQEECEVWLLYQGTWGN